MVLTVGSQAQAASTINWKGVTWEVNNVSPVINLDGSLTLTLVNTADTAGLHVNRLPWGGGTFDTVMDPWVQWSFEGHKGTMFIQQESGLQPTIHAGSNWGKYWAYTQYTGGDQYMIWEDEGDPIAHTLYVGKRTDGTVDAQYDSDAWASSDFLKTNVGDAWGFNDVNLWMRAGTAGDTITFNDFQYGSGHDISSGNVIPEPLTMLAFGSAVCGLAGYVRKRRQIQA